MWGPAALLPRARFLDVRRANEVDPPMAPRERHLPSSMVSPQRMLNKLTDLADFTNGKGKTVMPPLGVIKAILGDHDSGRRFPELNRIVEVPVFRTERRAPDRARLSRSVPHVLPATERVRAPARLPASPR